MPFLKFSRDKRGYENFYLVESANRGKPRTRLLYWFRTPPNVKVGRTPFDADMRRALEEQNPDVLFDWDAIVRTPIPPPSDTERWRERRRLERAMRTAESQEVEEEIPAIESAPVAAPVELSPQSETSAADQLTGSAEAEAEAEPEADEEVGDDPEEETTAEPLAASNPQAPGVTGDGVPRRRRRRRRRGRKPQAQGEV